MKKNIENSNINTEDYRLNKRIVWHQIFITGKGDTIRFLGVEYKGRYYTEIIPFEDFENAYVRELSKDEVCDLMTAPLDQILPLLEPGRLFLRHEDGIFRFFASHRHWELSEKEDHIIEVTVGLLNSVLEMDLDELPNPSFSIGVYFDIKKDECELD